MQKLNLLERLTVTLDVFKFEKTVKITSIIGWLTVTLDVFKYGLKWHT